jgi:hypothetical protein
MTRRRLAVALAVAAGAATAAGRSTTARGAGDSVPDVRLFFEAAARDEKQARSALAAIAGSWRDGYAALILDLARFFPVVRRSPASGDALEPAPAGDERAGSTGGLSRGPLPATTFHPGSLVRQRLTRFLEKQTGQRHGDDLRAWRRWLWNRTYEPHPDFLLFKAMLYREVDPTMASFFPPGARSLIRLDEVDWGGVKVNGIPPLDHPRAVPASAASWLGDKHVVFGIALGGEARAYPKRILAWHELARDRLGGHELTIVYCTLCGTVIPYGSEAGGVRRRFGTSGLLYRSNKLLFDEETMSLWSTLEGRPVIGPLAGSDLELTAFPVVTTTWREWRSAHPDTTVLSIDTGHERDYAEGAAYRDYFATDRIMFEVPRTDPRLGNKDEILGMILRPAGTGAGTPRRAIALSTGFLARHGVHRQSFAGHDLVIVTSRDGANRVYQAGGTVFSRARPDGSVEDAGGGRWRVTEEALVQEASGERRRRVPARRAFWFGWYAQFPDTELVK